MIRILTAAACAAAFAAFAGTSPAEAQSLSSGDYELCSVYRPDGSFAGYDSACLEAQRAAVRRFSEHRQRPRYTAPSYGGASYGHSPYGGAAMLCPSWANNGFGYSSTMRTGAGISTEFGTFNSSVNGQPCIPNPVRWRPGLP